jgi:hypothetical protein
MSDGLFQGDMLSASEYYGGRRRRAIAEPILRLMRAVFDVAWADASYRGSLQPWVRRRHEAVGWFVNPNGSEGPFAFRDLRSARLRCRRDARENLREAGAHGETDVYAEVSIIPQSQTGRAARWPVPRSQSLSKEYRFIRV